MERQAMNPVAIVAGGFAGGVLAMLLLERLVARAQRVVPARPANRAAATAGSRTTPNCASACVRGWGIG